VKHAAPFGEFRAEQCGPFMVFDSFRIQGIELEDRYLISWSFPLLGRLTARLPSSIIGSPERTMI